MEAVGQLTGGIAHDFNNLLTIIIGNLDTMRRALAHAGNPGNVEELRAKLTKPVESALKGANSAAQLTQRLLAFSRRQALEPARVDLNRLVTDMTAKFFAARSVRTSTSRRCLAPDFGRPSSMRIRSRTCCSISP